MNLGIATTYGVVVDVGIYDEISQSDAVANEVGTGGEMVVEELQRCIKGR